MHFNGPQTKFIVDSLYEHPVFQVKDFKDIPDVGMGHQLTEKEGRKPLADKDLKTLQPVEASKDAGKDAGKGGDAAPAAAGGEGGGDGGNIHSSMTKLEYLLINKFPIHYVFYCDL